MNPATEEILATFAEHTPEQVDIALEEAQTAFLSHTRTTTLEQRSELLSRVATSLRKQRTALARLATLEMGKPIVEAEAEIDKCAWTCDFYAEHARRFLTSELVESNAQKSYVAFEPLGVILAIMPWNFPYWQVFRFAAPALMAGNTVILKHAPIVPQCAFAIERLFREAGFPPGMLRALFLSNEATEQMIGDERVRAVTLTGSERAGSAVGAAAGHALKKTVLELGGSDPFIVLEDADLASAVQAAVRSRFQNTGQSCLAAKRFFVVEAVADEFLERFIAQVAQLRVGDPLDRATQIGPLARRDLRDSLHTQVQETLRMGGRLELGGEQIEKPGYFYRPTIVSSVTQAVPMFQQETFGPAAAVIHVKYAAEALALANASRYGLGSSIWTRDIDHARELASHLQTGAVFINGMVASDPRLPFGGVKNSGYGRELSSYGIREFVNIQTVWIGPTRPETSTSKTPECE